MGGGEPLLGSLEASRLKRAIVNVDDVGATEEGVDRVAALAREDLVSSVSVMVHGAAFPRALEIAGVDVGLHFDLCPGAPKREVLALGETIDADEVLRRLEAQIDALELRGVRPTHVDGHYHIHTAPAVAEPFARTLAERGLRWTRLPLEDPCDPRRAGPRQAEVERWLRQARAARPVFERHGLTFAGHFRGLLWIDRMPPGELAAAVASLPDGVAEIMVHPNERDAAALRAAPRFPVSRREAGSV